MALAELPSVGTARPAPFAFDRADDLTVVWLRGEHDLATVAALSVAMDETIGGGGSDLVVDLSGVEFMGAETVGAILSARNALIGRSRSLSLRAPSASARRVLDACLLDDDLVHQPLDASCAGRP